MVQNSEFCVSKPLICILLFRQCISWRYNMCLEYIVTHRVMCQILLTVSLEQHLWFDGVASDLYWCLLKPPLTTNLRFHIYVKMLVWKVQILYNRKTRKGARVQRKVITLTFIVVPIFRLWKSVMAFEPSQTNIVLTYLNKC